MRNNRASPHLTAILAMTAATAVFTQAEAASSVKLAGPIGGSDIRSALLPPPGFYGLGVFVPTPPGGIFDGDGNVDDEARGKQVLGGIGGLYVYDAEVFGGRLGSSLFVPYTSFCFGFTRSAEECSTGIGDIYSDVFVWSRFFPSKDFDPQRMGDNVIPFGLAVSFGLGVNIPTGKYDASSVANVGSNKWDFAPNFALTYTTKSIFGGAFGDATEFSARVFYNTYTENNDINYQDGDLVNIDFAATQRFGRWQVGLYGAYVNQIEDDKVDGVAVPGGGRAKGFGLGPLISYDFAIGDRPWNVTLKTVTWLDGQNYGHNSSIILKIGGKFF